MRQPGQLLGNLLCGVAMSAALAAPARADGGAASTLWLSLPSCDTPPYQPAELEHALAVELGARGLSSQLGAGSPSAPRVLLSLSRCAPDAESITLQISTRQGRALPDRTVELRSIEPRARARTVALLIVEALEPPRLSGSEESTPPGPEVEEQGTAPGLTLVPQQSELDELLLERQDPYPSPLGLRLGVAAHAHLILRDNSALVGLELSAGGRLARRVEGSYSSGDSYSGGLYYEIDTQGRSYELQWYQAALGLDLLLLEQPQLSVGPRFGVARVIGDYAGDQGEAAQERALLLTLSARFQLSVPLTRYMDLKLALELGDHIYEHFFTPEAAALPMYGMIMSWGLGVTFKL
jgi:hypothetical protein